MAAHQVGALDHLLATLSSESDDCDEEGREGNTTINVLICNFLTSIIEHQTVLLAETISPKPKIILRDRLASLRCKVLSNIPFISWRSKCVHRSFSEFLLITLQCVLTHVFYNSLNSN